MNARYETRGVLVGAYLRTDDRRAYLTHTVRIEVSPEDERRTDCIPLCKKVKPDNICENGGTSDPKAPPTCPTCLRRDPRFRSR